MVLSDESALLKKTKVPHDAPTDWSCFSVTPRVDQSEMFAAVYTALGAGKAVGIFPEGGSHDQPSLMPLKV